MNISEAILAESEQLPPIGAVMYQYVVAGNGLFIRAEDSRLSALVPIAPASLNGLADLVPFAELNVDRVPGVWMRSVLASARKHMPNEAMYQFWLDGASHNAETRTWCCSMPQQLQSVTAVTYNDLGQTVIDLHSHNSMAAFFSATDDTDEHGLRFYAVIGRIDTGAPEIRVRVGVYGHFLDVPADMVFDDLGPFVDRLGDDKESDQQPDYIAGPMWGCALFAKNKKGEPQILAQMIAATDCDDAQRAAIEAAQFAWPEYQGYCAHDCAVIYAHE